MSITKCRTFLE